jgi:hypothetical protein
MDKYSVDFDSLATNLLRKKVYLLSEVENQIEKVAFDVVRFRDNKDTDLLWKVQEGPEGPVIVALYDDNTGSLMSKDSNSEPQQKKDWEAVSDKKTASVHLFYKSEPVIRIQASEVGIPTEEIDILARWLPEKLQTNPELQTNILKRMAKSNREIFVDKYPELRKAAANI